MGWTLLLLAGWVRMRGLCLGFLHSWIYSVITHICTVSWIHINDVSDSNRSVQIWCGICVSSLTSNTACKTINFCYRGQRNKSSGHGFWHRQGIPIQVKARIFLLEKMFPTDIASTSASVSCLGSCSMLYKKKKRGGGVAFCNIILKNTQVFKALDKTGCVHL